MEIFKDIKDYKGLYQVSNKGRVKSLKCNREKVLKYNKGSGGYLQVFMYKDKKRTVKKVHQLVAMSFLKHSPCGHELVCNHIDFNKGNNKVENLEIITQRQNSDKKHLPSSSKYTGVSWDKEHQKWSAKIWINPKRKHLGYFTDELKASIAYQLELHKIN
tara:strand:+ start:886 stop:1365 length:480 start_codon:yes stop_codon:yes gene_type:complete